jgi:hypothetical protein
MDDLPDLQSVVQRKLGRCMLQLQQYEKLLKAMNAHNELSGPVDQLNAIREQKIASTRKATMGTLVKMLTESYLAPLGSDEENSRIPIDSDTHGWVSYRCKLEMSDEQFETTKTGLRELVDLRNNLAHHFSDQFNLWSAAGCVAADASLEQSYQIIHRHYWALLGWAKSMDHSRTMMASFIQSPDADYLFDTLPFKQT